MSGTDSIKVRTRKTTTEECFSLDASSFAKSGRIPQPGYINAPLTLTWSNRFGQVTLSVPYWVENLHSSAVILHLGVTPLGNVEAIDLRVRLETTRPNFGGKRWWFLCPLFNHGAPCERRVRKLYRPPSAWYFGCRACQELTYRSAQEHDARVDTLAKDPYAIRAALDGDDHRKALLALKACAKIWGWY
jgi:hypothetical protein